MGVVAVASTAGVLGAAAGFLAAGFFAAGLAVAALAGAGLLAARQLGRVALGEGVELNHAQHPLDPLTDIGSKPARLSGWPSTLSACCVKSAGTAHSLSVIYTC